MASIINSDDGVISGTAGLKSTGASDGALNIQTNGTNAITVSSAQTVAINGNNISADNSMGFRNRIINGDMRIDQRNAGAAVTSASAYVVDRFQVARFATDELAWSIQQDSSAPTGFVNSTKVTITTAESTFTTNENTYFNQPIEGTNISDLAWGSASAKTVTLSFWVRSSLTGTFGGCLYNSAADRFYPFSYSISSANTWEQKSVTIAGDTSGTWLTTTGIGIVVQWSLGAGPDRLGTAGAWTASNNQGVTGQVQVSANLNATWYITGAQLEVGSVATPFERRDYGTELSRCQRYFYRFDLNGFEAVPCWAQSANASNCRPMMPVTMRADPTITRGGTIGDVTQDWSLYNNNAFQTVTQISLSGITNQSFRMQIDTSSGVAGSDATGLYALNTDGGASLTASAEL